MFFWTTYHYKSVCFISVGALQPYNLYPPPPPIPTSTLPFKFAASKLVKQHKVTVPGGTLSRLKWWVQVIHPWPRLGPQGHRYVGAQLCTQCRVKVGEEAKPCQKLNVAHSGHVLHETPFCCLSNHVRIMSWSSQALDDVGKEMSWSRWTMSTEYHDQAKLLMTLGERYHDQDELCSPNVTIKLSSW